MPEPSYATERLLRVEVRALRVRLASVRAVRASRWGFLGSCLSVADVLAVLAERLRLAGPGEETPDHDRLVLSKGHAAPALYAAVTGWRGDGSYAAPGSPYQGHPNLSFLPAAGMTSGSLGLAVPAAAGSPRARAARRRGARRRGPGRRRTPVRHRPGGDPVGGPRRSAQRPVRRGRQRPPVRWRRPPADATRRMLSAAAPAFAAVDGHDAARLDDAIGTLLGAAAGPAVLWAATTRGKGVPAVEERPVPMSWIPDDAVLAAAEEHLTEALRRACDRLARPVTGPAVPGRSS
ncbi:hypothetical protein O1L60_36700 [Streptomyces diastatochromogenes]|nr:hypothetical protein [Streptomyces diastatochromogenes]